LYEYGGPEKLQFEDDVPEPALRDDTVLVQAAASSVNPIDWKIRSGARQKDIPLTLPAILGRDLSGRVRAVGRQVRTFRPGDRVLALSWQTYAEVVAVEEAVLTHLPDGLSLVGGFDYASTVPAEMSSSNPTVTLTRVNARPDASKVREFADAVRDGTFRLPISRRMPLREAGEAHRVAQSGGAGKIVLVCQ